MTIAVVAHSGKTMNDGLAGLRRRLAERGTDRPAWYEVDKSKKAPKVVRRAVLDGASTVLVWGGDGMVQHCIDATVGNDVALGILPAGTANLLAGNLGIPDDLDGALAAALDGEDAAIDVGSVNGEHFAVMAGCGFDAMVMRDADSGLKSRVGRLAYIWTGARNLSLDPVGTRITVDGDPWFDGDATCVLVGNVGSLFAGVDVFENASFEDGMLEVGVVTASNPWHWARTIGRTTIGRADRSPFVHTTRGKRIDVRLARPLPYELDGGDRAETRRLKIRAHPAAVRIRVPAKAAASERGRELVTVG